MKHYLYEELINEFRSQIEAGYLSAGDRMPSIRKLCIARNISKSTVLNAYGYLESLGMIESRPRSGYFVRSLANTAIYESGRNSKNQYFDNQDLIPGPVTQDQFVLSLMERGAAFDLIPGINKEEDNIDLSRCLARACRRQSSSQQSYYDSPQGLVELRQEIARRYTIQGSMLSSDDITMTGGCQHALLIALMATTHPGDIIAVESPCFYGAIQLIQTLGLQILELPSDPVTGLHIDTVTDALSAWDVKVLMLSPSFSTPTGASINDETKQQLVNVCETRNVIIIEDDIYGELSFDINRPRTLYSFDRSGTVILCSSFSKSLSRDLRIGWIVSSKYLESISRLKVVTALSISQTWQIALADYMRRGLFERHIRKKRILLAKQCHELQTLLVTKLPEGLNWFAPKGGLSLWVMLPSKIDTAKLYNQLIKQGITITPGLLFSAQGNYRHCLRISFAHQWIMERVQALELLGDAIKADMLS